MALKFAACLRFSQKPQFLVFVGNIVEKMAKSNKVLDQVSDKGAALTAFRIGASLLVWLLLVSSPVSGAELKLIQFPPVPDSGGKPLIEALHQRQTIREIKTDPLSNALLGNLLWAAFGINRPAIAHRTAPSAMNAQEINVYVARRDGLYLYEPKGHQLKLIAAEDLRSKTSGQDFGTNAPITLIYVADLSRLDKARPESRLIYANFDAGCISQNVYLFCASEGLATVVHDLDRAPLAQALKLGPNQRIIMAQAVGWPRRD